MHATYKPMCVIYSKFLGTYEIFEDILRTIRLLHLVGHINSPWQSIILCMLCALNKKHHENIQRIQGSKHSRYRNKQHEKQENKSKFCAFSGCSRKLFLVVDVVLNECVCA